MGNHHKSITDRFYIKEILTFLVLLIFVFRYKAFEDFFARMFSNHGQTVEWTPLYMMTLEYLQIVVIASIFSGSIAMIIGIGIHVFGWKSLMDITALAADVLTTFPTVAVMALLVPTLGYGSETVIVALFLYGLLPVLRNTLEGLTQVDTSVAEAADGMGMTPWQKCWKVELPIAMPVILAGLRTMVIINIAAATVGSVVGAGGLGLPIVSGIRRNDAVLILKGAIPVGLLAILADRVFFRLERGALWRLR